MRPTLALIDPDCTATLPAAVVACSGFDVLSHALESYTARPYTHARRARDAGRAPRVAGRKPVQRHGLPRSAAHSRANTSCARSPTPSDREARERMMFAATLAGIGFGNAGVHVPHAMSYAVAGLVRDFHADGYPGDEPLVPHGMAVIVNAPSVVRFTGARRSRAPSARRRSARSPDRRRDARRSRRRARRSGSRR